MKLKFKLFFTSLLLLTACSSESKPTSTTEISQVQQEVVIPEKLVKEWLITAIEDYFATDETDMEAIATKEYSEYCSDAINIQYDGLTYEEFAAKWEGKYEIAEDKIPQGFLIEVQDYNKIEVEQCVFIKKIGENWVFRTTLLDKAMKLVATQDIRVTLNGSDFRISDVN
jgi:hypothetical protein